MSNWKLISRKLANQLANHDYCDRHDEITNDCVFCMDRAAYLIYTQATAQRGTRCNWRDIADILAARMCYHAFCNQHRTLMTNCPFCDDIASYQAYVKAASLDGHVEKRFEPPSNAEPIPIWDYLRSMRR